MATYLKRTSKLFDSSLSQSSVDISLRDLICPVCRSILIEPVTLPCTHNLCLKCLRGTFEHNSLSCPLCRVRVGSWLRTATKTETLVNNGLWELIRTRFSKEVEDKCNGDDRDPELDTDFTAAKKILSAAGEIRQEYEAQLQIAEEEIRCQRKAEQMASEALIRKIQEEDQQQQLAQLAQDQLLAKSLVKKQLVAKHRDSKYRNDYSTASSSSFQAANSTIPSMPEASRPLKVESENIEGGKVSGSEQRNASGTRRTNVALMSKTRAERYACSVNSEFSGVYEKSVVKFCCEKSMPVYNAVTKSLRHHQIATNMIVSNSLNCLTEPGTSSSKIYGTQSKEELQVPNDVVNSKKKSLGVEVCITSVDDDERMGSAESAGSHDSINQEIHHFKPIKAMPRTPLKISTDGRQIDPKLIRVVPILKRISNVVPKPPSQAHLKRVIGCSWSAFRGKTKQISREKEVYEEDLGGGPSTSYEQQAAMIPNKMTKSQIHELNVRKLDFASEISFDSNKNYAKNVNRSVNGTKVGKKLTEEHAEVGRMQKSWKAHVRNGMVCKSKRQRHLSIKKDTRSISTAKYTDEVEMRTSTSSSASVKMSSPCDEDEFGEAEADDVAMENIAERIKKRKTNAEKKSQGRMSRLNSGSEGRRSTRKRGSGKEDKVTEEVPLSLRKRTRTRYSLPKSRQQRVGRAKQSSTESSEKSDGSVGTSFASSKRQLSRKPKRAISNERDTTYDSNNYNSSESCSEMPAEFVSENNNTGEHCGSVEKSVMSDEEIIKEQERMERLVIQEKEDFELAQRLQAKFDEMERIAGRTRRSRKAIESEAIELDLYKIDLGRSIQNKPSLLNHTVNAEVKKRGRPSKRVK